MSRLTVSGIITQSRHIVCVFLHRFHSNFLVSFLPQPCYNFDYMSERVRPFADPPFSVLASARRLNRDCIRMAGSN